MTFGVNTSPLAGREGTLLTSRQIKARLEREVLGNVSIEVRPDRSRRAVRGARPRGAPAGGPHRADAARGFELTASRPEVLLRDRGRRGPGTVRARDHRHPARFHRRDQAALAGRKGRLEQMTTDADGRCGWSTSCRCAASSAIAASS